MIQFRIFHSVYYCYSLIYVVSIVLYRFYRIGMLLVVVVVSLFVDAVGGISILLRPLLKY